MFIWIQSDPWFCKNEGSKRSNKKEKGINSIENQGEERHKRHKN